MIQDDTNLELSIVNRHPSTVHGPALLHELVQASSELPAIDFLENGSTRRVYTYTTLHLLSDKLADAIFRISTQFKNSSPIIPVLLPQCPELYITLLGILKAGKAFCPLSLDTPCERLNFILQDLSADLLVSSLTCSAKISVATDVQRILVDSVFAEQHEQPRIHLPCVDSNDLAYVLYTSGSTGLPKAVSVSHRAVTQSLLAHDGHIPEFRRFLQFAAPTFDVSIFEIYFTWFRGRTLVSCTRAQMLDDLPRCIRDLEVDAAELTPTVVSNLLPRRSSIPCLKLLLTIGEMLTKHIIDEYGGDDSKESMLWGMYGPTEAAIHCTVQPRLSNPSPIGSIGFPLSTVTVLVVTPTSDVYAPSNIRILPKGEIGELVIVGPQIAQEYINRPELTAASFIDHPEFGRLYRTGDLVRIYADEKLEFLGRVSAGQAKLRGQRIELGEIENTVLRINSCFAAAAIIIEENLVLFCATESRTISRADIFHICREWLPKFMVPSAVYIVPSMPQLSSGKIDKNALESKYLQEAIGNDTMLLEHGDHVAVTLLRILGQLTRHKLDLNSDLTSIGMDSLQSIRLASMLRHEGYYLSAIDILTAENLGDVLKICRDSQLTHGNHESSSVSEIVTVGTNIPELDRFHADIACITLCSPLQEAMLAKTVAQPSAYCNWIELELPNPSSFKQIRDALLILVNNNEVLRSGFYSTSSRATAFLQIVWKELKSSQIQEVSSFSRHYSLGSDESLLRPLNVQVKSGPGPPRVLFQIHHALYDGWSIDFLLRDLGKRLHGKDPMSRPQYRDVVRYYKHEQPPSENERHEKYWADLLRDYVPMTLPNYNGKIFDSLGVRIMTRRSAVSIDSLSKRARDLAIHPQVFFQAAIAYVLSLYTGSTDVVLGNVTSGRTLPITGIEDIFGPCIASLPFRLDFQHLNTVYDVLLKTQALNRNSLQHCSLPSREIAKAAHLQPGAQLFEVLFVWQQSLVPSSDSIHDVRIVDSADDSEYTITLEFEPRNDCVMSHVTFDPSWISENQAKYLFEQIDEVVALFLQDTTCKITDINFCFTDHSRSIANPNPCRTYFSNGPAYSVEKWASISPEKDAIALAHVVDRSIKIKDTITYGNLNECANQLARVLLEHGAGQNQLIGLIMEKSIEMYISILAIAKCGSGYLPLVPDTPLDRIKLIFNDAQISICIYESSVSGGLRQGLSVNFLDFDSMDLSNYSSLNLEVPYDGSHLAYAVFTSGSTGAPKGVLVTQDNLMHNLQYLSSIYPYTASSRMLQASSQAFDVSVFEIFFAWHVGICLCAAKKDDLFHDLTGVINILGVTHLSLTPTVAALIEPEKVSKVQFLVTAGEALTEGVRKKWASRGLYQGYGPSETTNICTVNACVSTSDLINNIGRPFDNTSAFVLDPKSDTILPRGAVGELCFGGAQVFREYLNSPQLNATKIIEHDQYGRVYRSGDMGILLDDDSILFTGRFDDQVKIRGQRVELGEITSVMLDHEKIHDCATVLVPGPNGSQTLTTFWVPNDYTKNSIEILDSEKYLPVTLESFSMLSRRLPSYMVPSYLVPISGIPLTAQTKIDKQSLQKMFTSVPQDTLLHYAEPHGADEQLPLWSEREKGIAKVLAQLLDIPIKDVRRTSPFLSLGLDSVSAISFCNALRNADLGDFPVSAVLKSKTVAHLASTSYAIFSSKSCSKVPEISLDHVFQPKQISRILSVYKTLPMRVMKIRPCTPLQEAMLSAEKSSLRKAYCNVMVFSIKGDISRIKECWVLMSQRHETLRTSFIATEDSAYAFAQVILDNYEIPWYNQEWHSNSVSHATDVLENLLNADQPPVYLAIAKESTSTKLMFCCHHALYDGIAVTNLLKEVQDLYYGHQLPPSITYDVYLQHMISQDLVKADQYWSALFKDFEPALFPNLSGRAIETKDSPSCVSRRLHMPLNNLRQACHDASFSLLSAVQAAWAKMLHFYTGENDVCFGNVTSGRNLPGQSLERLVAPCFNTLPVRVNFDFSSKNSSLMNYVHTLNIELLDFQLTPLRRIQNLTLKEHGRLFDTLVILQQPSPPLDDSIWTIEQDEGRMDLPIVCEVFEDHAHDALDLTLHYQASLLSEADAVVVARTFDLCISSMINYPDATANDPVGFPADLRAESNMNFRTFQPTSRFLHSGFEENTNLQPDRIALDFLHSGGAKTIWSFEMLNARANSIAHTLIAHGIEPEHVIPIHMSKSPQFYASVLGVLKSGAAFAPMHPELPEALKEFMLKELNAPVILHSEQCPLQVVITNAILINVDTINQSNFGNPATQGWRDTNLAYCLFTSGSTGTPKAVAMEHRSPIQTIESSRSLVPWTSSSRILQYAAVTFDMCYYDCFLAWSLGFTLCAADQIEMANELPKVINTLDVDLLDLTPSIAMSLKRSQVPSVKWLYCIGETMSSDVLREWDGLVVNSYGPSEAAFCTTIHSVTKDMNTSVIGKPFPSTAFAVFSAQGDRPLPLLSIGELYIGGAQLARGYFDKPVLTDQRFVSKCGQRFHKSGDLVRMLSDCNFEFIGRTDDQVKIRGQRVELGEINHVLRASHPGVMAVVTQIFKKDATAKDQLVAFIVLHNSDDYDERVEIQQILKKAAVNLMPSYMVPQFFLCIEEVPRSPAGKVDKRVLLEIFREWSRKETPSTENSDHVSMYQWTELEMEIRQIFARLSKTPSEAISSTTSIYQLGFDSISAVQIAAALRTQGHNIKAADVLKYMTCTEISAFLNETSTRMQPQIGKFDFESFERKHKATVLKNYNINEGDVEAIRPCTPLQKGMISQFLAKNGSVYMNFLHLKLQPTINIEKLRSAWATVMDRHAILRAGFAHVEDARYPFVMIHYTSNAIDLPWNMTLETESSLPSDEWLQNLQNKALDKFHLPPWGLRIEQNEANTYLDISVFHGLFDAQSLQSIFKEVVAAYNDQPLPKYIPLDPVIDGILNSSTADSVEKESFWSQFAKNTNPTRFPNLAPLRFDFAPPMVHTRYSARSLSDLESKCREANTTLQAAGIASWLSLLASYTGEQSVACGVVLSGRDFEAAENAVFPCINTMPFACVIPPNGTELLTKVMTLNAELQEHQHTPLNDVQKLMGFPNEPLFDSIFAYQKWPDHDNENDLWIAVDEKSTIEYPVSIELEPNKGRLTYRLTFLPHIIPVEQARLILDQFDHLMECLLHSETQTQVLPSFSPTVYSSTPAKEPVLPSEARFLHEFVELTAAKYPKRIAFEYVEAIHECQCSCRKWTYAELNEEGNRIAHLLISRGVLPGQLIGICFNKCPEASIAILGILKAGCAFVAIDPGAPVARQAFVVQDSQARVVLSMVKESAPFKEKLEVPILNLDEVTTHDLSKSKPLLAREIGPQDRSYCLYTSGTTGTPKGCELTHENAVQAMLAFQRLFAGHWDEQSRWLQFASFHFDVSVLEQYWSWSVGICVVSAPRDLIFEDIAKAINALSITHIDLTPSLAQLLHPDDVPSLCRGVFITGGESLKQEILDVWGQKQVIYNGYGPTEATIGVTMYPRVSVLGKPSNIGQQFDNVGSFVLQPGSDIPVLRGGVGELCVSGKLVGKGYLNRPELTSERFPYLERFGERVYRTGDLVRILHDGSFDFLGRADDQVKLRGQRLEVSEINSVIKQCGNDISDAATLVLKHPEQQKEQLVSFIVIGRRSNNEAKVLWRDAARVNNAKESCQAKLPPYMVPTHFIPLTSMPLNVNNKADGRNLRQIYETLSGGDLQKFSIALSGHDQPWSKQELGLREVLSGALSIVKESFGKSSSFFELGMDSISVIGVSRALKLAGFTGATVSMVLQFPTIHRLAKILAAEGSTKNDHKSILAAQQAITAFQHRHKREVARSLSIDSSQIEAIAPCTPLQEGIIAKYLESENGLYFNSFHFKLTKEVNEKRLRAAWQDVYATTPILRTAFVDTNDGYVQVVLRDKSLRWPVDAVAKNELSGKDSLDLTRQKRLRFSQVELRRPFRILSVRTPQQSLVVMHMFHGLYDGYSISLIFKAVWEAYNGRKPRENTPSFHSALPYGPLRVIEGAKDFWLHHLSAAPSAPFPALVDEPSDRPIVVERQMHALTNFDSTRRKLNVTAQAIGQACWLSVLQLYAKLRFTTGIVVSGRSIDLEGVDAIVGPMFNTIPYNHDLHRHETWSSLIKRVHDFNTDAHPYQHTPLRDIMKWFKRIPSQPFFDTLFVFKMIQDDEEWAKNEAWEILDRGSITDYALAFEIEQRPNDCFTLTLVTQGHISDERISNELLDRFEEALRQVLTDPQDIFDMSVVLDHFARSEKDVEENTVKLYDGTSDYRWTSTTSILREEIATLCGVQINEITESTSIFELGLDSIDAIKLSLKLKMRGVHLPVSGIMRGLTIAKMELNISNEDMQGFQRASDADLGLQKKKLKEYLQKRDLNTEDIEDVLPLTPLQEAMVAEMILSDYSRYYNYDVLMLNPGTDIAKLHIAMTRVVESSPILRTSFVEVDDPDLDHSFAQIIHQQPHEFWSHSKTDDEHDFPVLFQKIRDRVITLELSQPLFNILHFESPSQSYLILSIAHALYDGWSLGLLHSDFQDAYHDHFIPRPDFQTSLAEILTASGSDAASFWQDFLAGATLSALPRRMNDSKSDSPIVHRHQQSSKMAFEDIIAFTKNGRVSLQSLGQAVFAMVLASYTQSLDVTFGSVLSGRDDDERAQLLFPTMNTVAIRVILHGSRSEMMHYVQDTFQSIKEWQHFPLRKALALAGLGGKFFDSLFIYQKSTDSQKIGIDSLYTSIESHSDVEYPVCIEMEVVEDELVWRCAAKEEVFDEEGVKEILHRLDEVLREILDQPELPVIDFTVQDMSICGFPPFIKEKDFPHVLDHTTIETGDGGGHRTNLKTARKIREVLAAVSRIPEDGITSEMTIFHIGLDSISAIKVSSQLRKQGIILGVGEMLRAGTIEKMASIVDARAFPATEEDKDIESIVRTALQGLDPAHILRSAGIHETELVEILPITAGQLYMLSMWGNSKGRTFYPEFTYELHGDVTFEVLQRSWQALVNENAILRTFFVSTNDENIPYVQIVLRSAQSSLTNITGLVEDEISDQVQKVAGKQPWAHLFVSQISTGWTLKLHIHHALYDGVSLPLLIHQFQDLCTGAAISTSAKILTRLVAGSHATSALQDRQLFWTNYLKHAKQQLLISTPPPNSRVELFKPGLFQTSSLEAIVHKHGVSIQSLVLAAYGKLYGTMTNTRRGEDIILGVYLANRSLSIEGIETATIPTVNLVPLRIQNLFESSLVDAATQVQKDLQHISETTNASVSLFEISEWTGVKIDTFVNFLSLPDVEDATHNGHGGNKVEIRPAKQWQDRVSKVSPNLEAVSEVPNTLINRRVNEAYLHAIDIEATIRNSALDIGVFAPTSLLDLEQGEKLIDDLTRELMDLP